ncbi:MAG: hypothetical protein AB3N15_18435 [Paracoccaceae bacterium]
MSTYVSKEIRAGLEAARLAGIKKASRLRVEVGEEYYPVLGLWRAGFSVEAASTPRLRGLVDVYDGANHLYQCLIVASKEDGGEVHYEFKRSTAATDRAPLDFYRAPDAPVALLGKD